MRSSLLVLFMLLVVSTPLRAAGRQTALLGIQENCVAVGDISFGPRGRWADCQVSRGRWVSTIDLIDMYQAQYCLGDGGGTCRKRALLLFGNRAYTPTATLMLQRQDPGGTEYDDPQVVVNEFGRILTVTAHLPGGRASSDYYLWQSERWVRLDARHWLKDLPRQLPAGFRPGRVSLPDMDTMSATVSLLRETDAGCCHESELARVELGLRRQRFALKKMKFTNP
jgi:hypothetical protein